jgi:uncharacterized protein
MSGVRPNVRGMSNVDSNQPEGTPTWIDLGVPDLERAKAFYGALFGWDFGPSLAETGHYTMCLLRGQPVAALTPVEPSGSYWWTVYFATDDCDRTARRIIEVGGTLIMEPMEIGSQGTMAIAIDPIGAQFGLWQGGDHVGCRLVNEPDTLIRNDLVTPTPEPARAFYTKVFGFALDTNDNFPDFTFLRRPDGHEIGGISGVPTAPRSRWHTMFEVEDADTTAKAAVAAGGTAADPQDTIYARMSTITDPFGTEFIIGSRPR